MAYRLGGDRETVALEDVTIELQPIVSDSVYRTAVRLGAAYFAATDHAATSAVLADLATFFCAEAQPSWHIVDHRGVVAPTPAGMLRLPDAMVLGMLTAWAEAWAAEPPASAVDLMVPPGEMRDELNRRLKAA